MPRSTQNINTAGSKLNSLVYSIEKYLLTYVHTALPVKVVAVYPQAPSTSSGGDYAGFVDVQIQIDQIDSERQQLALDSRLWHLPYFRYQAGRAAFVIDPEIGDEGLACFSERDISRWKRTLEKNIPPSFRSYSLSDGFYFGGFRNEDPEVYIRISRDLGVVVECADKPCVVNCQSATVTAAADINIAAGGDVVADVGGSATVNASSTTINSPSNTVNGNLEVNGNIGVNGGLWVRDDSEIRGNVRMLSNLTVDGQGNITGVIVGSHRHGGVETGGGVTSGPV